jgi:hypothetical protein
VRDERCAAVSGGGGLLDHNQPLAPAQRHPANVDCPGFSHGRADHPEPQSPVVLSHLTQRTPSQLPDFRSICGEGRYSEKKRQKQTSGQEVTRHAPTGLGQFIISGKGKYFSEYYSGVSPSGPRARRNSAPSRSASRPSDNARSRNQELRNKVNR